MASVTTNEAANALRGLKQRQSNPSTQKPMRDTNKRARAASIEQEQSPSQRKKTDGHPILQYVDEEDVETELAAIAVKNQQLQSSVAKLQHQLSQREEETHRLLLGLGALNAVANELTALQQDYEQRSSKNAALIQESLQQIVNCSKQVDTLKRSRQVSATQLQAFRHTCTLEMGQLVTRLEELEETTGQELEPVKSEAQQEVGTLKTQVCEYRKQCGDQIGMTTTGQTVLPTYQQKMNVALMQLNELHAEMYELKECLVQENQSFRRHLENLVSKQMARIREVQDNDTERVLEEVDEIRSGMCEILKDVHRLKERTKYLVPSMARVGPRTTRSNHSGLQTGPLGMSSGQQNEERWIYPPKANTNPQSTRYSLTMASRQCQDGLPHYEHGFDDDCYCPGVPSMGVEAQHAVSYHHRSPRSSNSSGGRSDDDNWRMLTPEGPAAEQRVQPCESPHYSSRSSSLCCRVSVYGEEEAVANDAEQFERQLLEQHRLFWIGEGAG